MTEKLSGGMIGLCPGCKAGSRLFDWEKATKRACVSRAMRRDYKSILDPRNWAHGVERYYKCPVCGRLYRANQLRIQADPTAPADPDSPATQATQAAQAAQAAQAKLADSLGGEPLDIRVVQMDTPKRPDP